MTPIKHFFQLFTVPGLAARPPLDYNLMPLLDEDEHRELHDDDEMSRINDYEDSVNDKHWEE